VALGRTVAGGIVRRSAPVPTPLRRGAAAVVVSGGVLSLAGVAATIPVPIEPVTPDPSVVAAAAVLPADETASPDTDESSSAPTTLLPVPGDAATADREQLDTAKLVKAAQLAERKITGAVPAEAPDGAADAANDDGAADDDGADDEGKDEGKDADRTADTAAQAGSSDCNLDGSQLGPVKSHVRSAARFLGCNFGEPTVLGVAGRAGGSDHPSGKALDFMVGRATGNAIAACALRNQEEFGISYVIWRQRINFGSGWRPMEDRGGATANHLDHVHVSFDSRAGGRPSAC
jgi:hypothetical protein